MDQTYGLAPPVTAKLAEYAFPTMPPGRFEDTDNGPTTLRVPFIEAERGAAAVTHLRGKRRSTRRGGRPDYCAGCRVQTERRR